MRVAFVGKGGSGKSTLSAAFASYLAANTTSAVAVFDADLNIHTPELLGFDLFPLAKHLSNPMSSESIKRWLIGDNNIRDLAMFRKTTPPTNQSKIIKIEKLVDTPLINYCESRDNLFIFAVGTYQPSDVGASCYHNNLAIFENILGHLDDRSGYLIADMVAGVDAFAGTLHAQFDLVCLVVEPTKRSLEVYEKYISLAEEAGTVDTVYVIGNKIRTDGDKDFIAQHIPADKLIGYFVDDEHIRQIEQNATPINIKSLNNSNQNLLALVYERLAVLPDARNTRLKKMWELHRKYVGQSFIKDRFGDLTNQIDTGFSFDN